MSTDPEERKKLPIFKNFIADLKANFTIGVLFFLVSDAILNYDCPLLNPDNILELVLLSIIKLSAYILCSYYCSKRILKQMLLSELYRSYLSSEDLSNLELKYKSYRNWFLIIIVSPIIIALFLFALIFILSIILPTLAQSAVGKFILSMVIIAVSAVLILLPFILPHFFYTLPVYILLRGGNSGVFASYKAMSSLALSNGKLKRTILYTTIISILFYALIFIPIHFVASAFEIKHYFLIHFIFSITSSVVASYLGYVLYAKVCVVFYIRSIPPKEPSGNL